MSIVGLKSTSYWWIYAAITFIILNMTCVYAQENGEIRSPVFSGSTLSEVTVNFDYTQFAGFYYDIDDNVGSESMQIVSSYVEDPRTITAGGLVYTSTIQEVNYKYDGWIADNTYPKMCFLGQEYVPVKDRPDVLSKLILDSDDKYTLKLGQSLDLGEGYLLTAKQIDVDGKKVWLELDKDGAYVDDQVVAEDSSNADTSTWDYRKDNVGGEDDVVIMRVHLKEIHQDGVNDFVIVEGLWLISDQPLKIESDDTFDMLEVRNIGPESLTLKNKDSIILWKGEDTTLAGDIKIKVADSNDVRFYFFKEGTAQGTYDVRSSVASGSASWDYSTFTGFYYDLDDNIFSETMAVTVTSPRTISAGDLVYSSTIQQVSYKYQGWVADNTYPKMGFLGQEYVPVKDRPDVLSKLILDSNDKYTLRVGQSLDLGDGYSLTIKQIDLDSKKVWLELTKNGIHLDDQEVTVNSLDADASTWNYKEDNVGGEDGVVVMRVHVDSVFQSQAENFAVFEGLWLISNDPIKITAGNIFDNLEVTNIGVESLTLKNRDDLSLTKGDTLLLADGWKFRIADSDELRYYLFEKTTVDKSALITAIEAANAKAESAVAGTETGQYPQSAIDVFKTAIATAQAVADNSAAEQAEVDQTVTNLKAAEAIFDAAKITTGDLTPPESVTDLRETGMGSNWIKWTWENPYDTDFSRVMVYIDGAFAINTSDSSYNSTGLSEGVHTISTKTFDTAGNINPTWVNDSATTATVNMDLVSHFGGSIYDVTVVGNHAYIGQGKDLVIFDISDSSKPLEVSRVMTASTVYSVAVAGNYAYVTHWNGFDIVDISDSSAPTVIASYDTDGYECAIALSGNYAYITSNLYGNEYHGQLTIVDISNPSAPTFAGSYDTDGWAKDIAVSSNYAYLACADSGLEIVDISNPSAPTLVGSCDTGFANGVAISGDYAYVTGNGLEIVDISDPSAPTLAGGYDIVGGTSDIAVAGNYAYVVSSAYTNNYYVQLEIVDISNPSSPTLVGIYHIPSAATYNEEAVCVAISGNYAYIADYYNGFLILDISTLSSPKLTAKYDVACDIYDITVSNNYAYVADGINGLEIFDIIDPSSPELVGRCETNGSAISITVSGSYAYITTSPESGNVYSLMIVDISNPYLPKHVGSYDNAIPFLRVAVADNYAYITEGYSNLSVVNVTNPSSPKVVGMYETEGSTYDVAVSGKYAYVIVHDFSNLDLDSLSDLVVLDITDASSPKYTGHYGFRNNDESMSEVYVAGNYAYVSIGSQIIGNGHLDILDVSIPSSPKIIGSYGYEDVNHFAISGNYTYIACADGVSIVDIRDPSSPTIAGKYYFGDWAGNVEVSGNYAYVVNDRNGLVVLRVGTASDKTPPASVTNLGENGVGSSWIRWTWINPSDGDFKHVMVYIDGSFVTNTSNMDYNLIGLSKGTTHIISTKTVDISGNINSIWVNDSATTSSSSSGGGGGSSGGSTTSKSSSGGGGGGAGSAEDYANVALKDVDSEYLRMNANVTYEFTKEGNPIQSVSLYSLKNSGQITSTIEVLNNRSKLVNSGPEGSIYKHVNIWVGKSGFATAANIKDARIKFKVSNSWIKDMGVSPADVKLQRFNGTAWEVLPTIMESNTTSYVIYESQTPGFSPFAITTEKALASPANGDTNGQSSVNSNVTSPTKETKTPGFEALFAVAGLLAVAYLVRRL